MKNTPPIPLNVSWGAYSAQCPLWIISFVPNCGGWNANIFVFKMLHKNKHVFCGFRVVKEHPSVSDEEIAAVI